MAVAGDTSDPAHVADAVAAAISAFGGLDVVVANAGGGFGGAVGDIDDERWRTTLDVNLTGPMMLTRAALPSMIARGGGSIVLVSSVNGMVAAPASAAYDTSKAGLIALARAIAIDYGPQGIRANAVCPGWVITPMGDEGMDEVSGRARDQQAGGLRPHHPGRAASSRGHRRGDRGVLSVPRLRRIVDRDGTTLVADGGGLAIEPASTSFGPVPEAG